MRHFFPNSTSKSSPVPGLTVVYTRIINRRKKKKKEKKGQGVIVHGLVSRSPFLFFLKTASFG